MTFKEMLENVRAWLHTKIKDESYQFWTDWLISFLGYELPAAWNDRKGDTFSEYVWVLTRWRWARIALGVFMLDLSSHFVFETPLWPF